MHIYKLTVIYKLLFRSDVAFGATFFLTRIMYNAVLAYRLADMASFQGVIWKVCVAVLLLHLYWFYKWFHVYGKNFVVGS